MRRLAIASTLLAAAVLALGGCASQSPTEPAALLTGVDVTDPPIAATPWANGTVGRYGLRVDPSLLRRLPSTVGGVPLTEAPEMEKPALDSEETAGTVESFASAMAGSYDDGDWTTVTIMRLRPEMSGDSAYATLRTQLEEGACSQAGGVDTTTPPSTETIGGRTVGVARCAGEPVAYTLKLDQRTLVSIVQMGDRQLGRQLLEAIP